MTLRTIRERILQTCAFEFGGLCFAVPLYATLFAETEGDSLLLIAAVSAAVLVWSPLHNALCDRAEWRLTHRLASDRPHRLRVAHAVSLETSSILLTLPLVMTLGGHGLREAVAVNIVLTALYIVYGYAFHVVFDRLRPVGSDPERTRRSGQSAGPAGL